MTVAHHFLHNNINLKADTLKRFGFLSPKAVKQNLKRFKTL